MKEYFEMRISQLDQQIADLSTKVVLAENHLATLKEALASLVGAKVEQERSLEVCLARKSRESDPCDCKEKASSVE